MGQPVAAFQGRFRKWTTSRATPAQKRTLIPTISATPRMVSQLARCRIPGLATRESYSIQRRKTCIFCGFAGGELPGPGTTIFRSGWRSRGLGKKRNRRRGIKHLVSQACNFPASSTSLRNWLKNRNPRSGPKLFGLFPSLPIPATCSRKRPRSIPARGVARAGVRPRNGAPVNRERLTGSFRGGLILR